MQMYTDSNFGFTFSIHGKREVKKMSCRTSFGSHLTAVATVTAGSALTDPVFTVEGVRVQKDEVLSDGSLKCLQELHGQ